MKLHDLQGVNHQIGGSPAAAATAVTAETIIGMAPFTSNVVGAYYIPAAAMAGAASNNRSLSIVNRGAAGAGMTALATITYTGGINGTALIANVMTLGPDVSMQLNDIITVQALVNGTGLPLPAGGLIRVNVAGG